MSLRLRTVLAIALVLAIGSLAGLAVSGWQANQTLREELASALAGGRQSVAGALNDAAGSKAFNRDLVRLVSTFDGDRHVEATLRDAAGQVIARSRPLRGRQAPGWFATLFELPSRRVDVVAPGGGVIALTPVVANDVAAIWAEFMGWLAVLGVSFVAGSTFVWLMLGPALRPLADFTAAFQRIGLGDYGVRVGEGGPMELVRLGRAVNQMTERLESMQARNQALESQIANLQEEERADLARDLHDEIGPHLFAVNVDAAMARRLIEDGKAADSLPRLRAIQSATAHMQTLVRDILGRLRPTEVFELGLEAAIAELVDFWRSRRPAIRFKLDLIPDRDFSPALRETLYRVVQEGLNNAVRHGRPTEVRVQVRVAASGEVVATIADDGAHAGTPGAPGFGLIGMRERVARAKGALAVDRGGPGRGWTLTARLPLVDPTPAPRLAVDA
jgi:two-component system sensor histidine kinase UhpB